MRDDDRAAPLEASTASAVARGAPEAPLLGATDGRRLTTALGRPGRLEVPADRTRPFRIVLDPS